MKIAFLGCRKIPAEYGGLETIVEELSIRLTKKGYNIFVVFPSDKFSQDIYKGITRVHFPTFFKSHLTIPIIGDIIGTLYLTIKHYNDIDIYFYTNTGGAIPAIFLRLMGKKVIINSDGVEWKRMEKRINFVPRYNKLIYYITRNLLYFLESLSCIISSVTIADSKAIKRYLEKKHNATRVTHIAYGVRDLKSNKSIEKEKQILQNFGITPNEYYLTVSRIVAENNIDMEIEGFKISNSKKKLVIIGNFNENDYYTKFLSKFKNNKNIIFLDSIYDAKVLGVIRKHCFAYIHSYEVGGTNPSLLEQMLFEKPILIYENEYNKEVIREGGIYFNDLYSLKKRINQIESKEFNFKNKINVYKERINKIYNWGKITEEYEQLFKYLEM